MSHGVVIRAHNGTTRSPATRRRSRHAAKGAVTQRVGLGPMRSRPVMKLSTSLAAAARLRVRAPGRRRPVVRAPRWLRPAWPRSFDAAGRNRLEGARALLREAPCRLRPVDQASRRPLPAALEDRATDDQTRVHRRVARVRHDPWLASTCGLDRAFACGATATTSWRPAASSHLRTDRRVVRRSEFLIRASKRSATMEADAGFRGRVWVRTRAEAPAGAACRLEASRRPSHPG
jgi:hypothetical protein